MAEVDMVMPGTSARLAANLAARTQELLVEQQRHRETQTALEAERAAHQRTAADRKEKSDSLAEVGRMVVYYGRLAPDQIDTPEKLHEQLEHMLARVRR